MGSRRQPYTDRTEIDRLNAIGLPPAYTNAWFSPRPDGHIQAIGWDDKGRKQYRYHPAFGAARENEKYRADSTGRRNDLCETLVNGL